MDQLSNEEITSKNKKHQLILHIKSGLLDEHKYAPNEANSIAAAINVLAWIIMVCGIIAGFILANQKVSRYESKFVWSVAITCWAVSIISGIILLGVSEIIKLLDYIAFSASEYNVSNIDGTIVGEIEKSVIVENPITIDGIVRADLAKISAKSS